MFGFLRGDVSGMKTIIKAYLGMPNRWMVDESERVSEFAEGWFAARYSVPMGSVESRQAMQAIATIAFPGYCKALNFDGSPSLFAVLGALSEAERIIVDPGIVARRCQSYFTGEISGKILGGVGIADIPGAFQEGAREFHEARARLERNIF